jgi:3-isopropylmalate dehydratase
MEEFRKHCLVNGLDDIGLTLLIEDKIKEFERKRTLEYSWLDGSGYLARRSGEGPLKIPAAKVPSTNRGEEKEITDW